MKSTQLLFLLIVVTVTCLVVPGAAVAATKYVDNSGSPACSNSASNGTESAPFCTVQYGISRLSGGDTLYVKNGTYAGDFIIAGPSGTSGAHTVISAYPGHTPVLSSSGYHGGRIKISHGCSYIDFIGFEITNHNQGLYLDDDAGTSTPCSNVTVRGVHIHDVGQEGLAIRAGSASGPRNFIVENSLIEFTGRLGSSQNGEGIYIGNSDGTDNTNGVIIRNNVVHDTQDECIELKGDSHDNIIENNELYRCITPGSDYGNTGGAIEIDEPRNSSSDPHQIIRGNVIHDIPNNSGITKRAIRAGSGATIYNNIIYNIYSGYTCILSNSSNYPRVIYHNTVDCSTATAIVNSGTTADIKNNIGPNTTNNMATNSAYYVNAARGDYHLAAGATPIDAGLNLTATVPADKDGVVRPQGAAPDRGAFEYAGASRPPAPTNLTVTVN